MEKKIGLGINKQQLIRLISFMQTHEDLAKAELKDTQGKKRGDLLWKELTAYLNELGPPIKIIHEWKKTWSDYKYKIRKKIAFNQLNVINTGDSPFTKKKFSVEEELVIKCAALKAPVSYFKNAKSFGIPKEVICERVELPLSESSRNYDIKCENDTSDGFENKELEPEPYMQNTNNTYKTKIDKMELMCKYVNASEELNNNVKELITEMKEIKNTLKRQCEIQEQIYMLKKIKMEEKSSKIILNSKIKEFFCPLEMLSNKVFDIVPF